MAPGARGSLVLLLALAATQERARATERATPTPHAKLVYFVDPEAVDCPTAEVFRAAVTTRAGHELFGEPSDVTIDVTLRHDADAASYVAILGLPGASGRATRELRSTIGCGELATAAALVVSIALDPESLLRPPPPAPPAPPPATRASRTWRALVGLGPRGAWGLTPDPTLGLAFSAAAVSDGVALGLELGGFLSDDAPYHAGTVSVLPFTMAFLPCALWSHLEACAVAKLGVLRGTGAGFSQNDATTKLFGAGGARAGYIVDAGRLRFRASLEGDVVAPRTSFVVNDTSVYTTRGVSLSAGLDALLFF